MDPNVPPRRTDFMIIGSPVQQGGGESDLELQIKTPEVNALLWGTWGSSMRLLDRFSDELNRAEEVVRQLGHIAVLEWIKTQDGECRGAGSALLESFIKLAKDAGAEAVFARFSPDEADSAEIDVLEWYEKRGFVRVDGTGIDEPLLVRPIQGR